MIKGLYTALITPFLPDGNVDFSALRELVELQIEAGVDGLVVLGTTAEAATLTDVEKKLIKQCVVKQNKGRVSLILGLGGNNTASLETELRQMRDFADWTAILSVCPYYNKPSQEGLFRHFSALAAASPLPIILYNVPGRTGVNLLPETVIKLKKTNPTQIIGIKEASGNIEQIKHLIELRNKEMGSNRNYELSVLSGDDGITAELMKAGANGLISVASNAFPRSFSQIVTNSKGEAENLQEKFASVVSLLFKEGNPAGIKTVLSQKGYIHNRLRLPLVENSSLVQAEIRQALAAL